MNNKIIIFCECISESLVVERYDEGNNDKGFYFSTYCYGVSGKIMGWRERFRWIWKILRTGSVWNDSIILNDENAKKLSNFLTKQLKK